MLRQKTLVSWPAALDIFFICLSMCVLMKTSTQPQQYGLFTGERSLLCRNRRTMCGCAAVNVSSFFR